MNKRMYNILYAVSMVVIIVLLLVVKGDAYQMFFGALAIILTSIFSYSNRDAISRKRRPKDDQ